MSRPQRPPLSPEAAAVVRAMSAGRLSRRSVLSGAGALGLGSVLAACGNASSRGSTTVAGSGAGRLAGPAPAVDRSDTENVVNWENWTLYLDKDASSKSYLTLQQFENITGIRATYAEDIQDNESYYATIQAHLRQGQDIGKDVIVLTDWMAARLVAAGWVQKLDKAVHLPNAANILDSLKTVAFDPGRNYSLTWQSGYTGLGWNIALLKSLTGKTELKTVDELWDPRLKGRVEVLSEMRDTIGLILLSQGVPIDTPFGRDTFDVAVGGLEKQLASNQIRQVRGNSYKDDLLSGDAVAVFGWSGDLFQLNTEAKAATPGLKDPFGFAVPESGGVLWSDNLLIPIGSPHKTNAETLMNYYYDPKVAAQVAAYVNYICPVKGAQTEIAKLSGVGADIVTSPYIFPDQAQLEQVHTFRSLSATEEKDFGAAFQQVLGS
jgi:spermidine/putrescine transport system substrate-binding protein